MIINGDLRSVAKLILKEKQFVIATHTQPDGDAIGSLLGLGLLLKQMNKKSFVSWGEPIVIPLQYAFLPGLELLQDSRECPQKPSNFIAIDCANLKRLGILKEPAQNASILVNIDHHGDNDKFGHINVVDENISACAELIFYLSKILNQKLNRDIALCLYTGMVTDTGRFQYSNTSIQTFQAAKELLEYGISPNYVFQNVYENIPFSYTKLLGLSLSKAKFLPDLGFIYTSILQKDLALTEARMEEAENLIDFLRAVKGTRVAAVLKEMSNGSIRVSLRSRDGINVAKIAERFGGGGHPNAAGYISSYDLDKTLEVLLKTIRRSPTDA